MSSILLKTLAHCHDARRPSTAPWPHGSNPAALSSKASQRGAARPRPLPAGKVGAGPAGAASERAATSSPGWAWPSHRHSVLPFHHPFSELPVVTDSVSVRVWWGAAYKERWTGSDTRGCSIPQLNNLGWSKDCLCRFYNSCLYVDI